MQSYKLNFFFILCFFPVLVFGQDPFYINYDTKDGVPSSEVHAVEIDSNGMLWFATDRGICSYNGYEFKTFTTEDGLVDNSILEIWKDSDGNFWFPGLNGSLTIFDHHRFYPYKWNDSIIAAISRPQDIARNNDDKLYFWRAAQVQKIYSIDHQTGIVKQEPFFVLKEKYKSIKTEITEFIQIGRQYLPDSLAYNAPKVIKTDTSLYFAQQIDVLDTIDHFIFKHSNKTKKLSSYHFGSTVLSLYLEKNSDLWVCTKNGLYKFQNADIDKPPVHYFKDLIITDIAMDQEDNYWLTTLQNGIFKVPSFRVSAIKTPINNYSFEKILSISKLKNHLFFGSAGGRIYAVDSNFKMEELKKARIDEQYWVTSNTSKYAYFQNVRLSENNDQIQLEKILSRQQYYTLNTLKNGYFFGTGYSHIRILDPSFEPYYFPPSTFFLNRMECIVERKNKIWIGTTDGLFSIKDYQYSDVKNESINNPLLQIRIRDLKLDNHENIWIATLGNGIVYKTEDTTFQITVADGLTSNLINKICVENNSSIWIATNRGLNNLIYSLDQNKLVINNISSYNTTDGLLTNFINSIIKWKDRIWLATDEGIVHFSPKDIEKNKAIPPIILDNVLVNEDSIDTNTLVDFKYYQNDWYFKFTGISYRKSADQPFYRYRLLNQNADSTWYYTNNRDIRFNDLLAGQYTFQAAAQNKFGQWSENPIKYQFTIKPHFTRTWWFLTFCILVLIAITIFLIQSRSNRIKQKEEQKRKLQEAELKTKDAELQALRNQMNPHFVFNALNSIQNFVFKNDAKKANYYLARFSKLMRDGLQFARLKYISLKEEIIFLNTYLELEKMRFPDKFQYRVIVDEEIPTNQYFIPPLLFQPILENAVKHAFKNIDYEGLLEIHFEEKIPGELLKITITDNGKGFNLESVNKATNSKNKSLGLEIINNQIALLNSEGKDRKASFRIFNRNSLDTQLTGMQAEFIISIKFSEND